MGLFEISLTYPNFARDRRFGRYEAVLWRQVGHVLLALDALGRCKPQQRRRRFDILSQQEGASYEHEDGLSLKPAPDTGAGEKGLHAANTRVGFIGPRFRSTSASAPCQALAPRDPR